jgi:type I restriction enzyme S subunit
MNDKDKARLREAILKRYPWDHERAAQVRDFLEATCVGHIDEDLGDADILHKLCSDDDARYWAQLSEVLLAHELMRIGLKPIPSHEGPDLLIEHAGRKIWIEVICPMPMGLSQEWLNPVPGRAGYVPHEALLLRWTAAIKEKAEKLLGNAKTGTPGYLAKKVVGENDAYVIAVNARMLRGGAFPSIIGVSQFPYAAEAAFSIGPYAISINRDTLERTSEGYQHRPYIRKPNGADVPAQTFLDPAFARVSAIWGADVGESWVIGNAKPQAVIHNPSATNPVPVGLLPAFDEFMATEIKADGFELTRRAGILAPPEARKDS